MTRSHENRWILIGLLTCACLARSAGTTATNDSEVAIFPWGDPACTIGDFNFYPRPFWATGGLKEGGVWILEGPEYGWQAGMDGWNAGLDTNRLLISFSPVESSSRNLCLAVAAIAEPNARIVAGWYDSALQTVPDPVTLYPSLVEPWFTNTLQVTGHSLDQAISLSTTHGIARIFETILYYNNDPAALSTPARVDASVNGLDTQPRAQPETSARNVLTADVADGENFAADTAEHVKRGQVLAMGNSPSGPDFSGWMYNCPLTFAGYTPGEVLTNFPALVRIGTNIAGFAWSQFANSANGFELRFSDATGTQELNYEFDSGTSTSWINAAGIGQVWVQVPLLTNGTTILAYWGNAAQTASRQAYTTNGATWSNGFEAVWHLNETASPYRDSALKHNATAGASPSRTTDSMVGYAQSFNGSKYLTAGTVNLGDKFCLSAWTKIATGANSCQAVLASKTSTTTSDGFGFYANTVSTSDKRLLMATGNGSSSSTAQTGINLLTYAAWHHVAALVNRSGTTATLCVDGANQTASSTIKSNFGNNKTTYLGQFSGSTYRFNGILDEVRIETAQRSTNWVWAEWRNMASNNLFQTWGGISSNNTPPIASFTATPTNGIGPLIVNFNASGSYDQDEDPLTYNWKFGDGSEGNGVTTTHTYTNAGAFTAVLTVNDGQGHTSTNSIIIDVPYLDTDGDGISDEWEIANGLNPYDPSDALVDVVGDGFPPIYKYKRGLNLYTQPTYQPGGMDILVTNFTLEAIQTAINSATNDYAIMWLPSGMYVHGNSANDITLTFGKKVMLSGVSGNADDTVLDATPIIDWSGRTCENWLATTPPIYRSSIQFVHNETRATVLRGVTITSRSQQRMIINCPWGGDVKSYNVNGDRGIYCENSSPTITKCVVEDCSPQVSVGGGLYSYNGSPVVNDCVFSGNGENYSVEKAYTWEDAYKLGAVTYGGGLYFEKGQPLVSGCTISGNYAAEGGGLYMNNATGLVVNCQISGHTVSGNGGGVYISGPSVLRNTLVSNNGSSNSLNQNFGGGIYAETTSAGCPRLEGCEIIANQNNYGLGGGLYLSGGMPVVSNCAFIGNSCDNSGGGLFADSACTPLLQCCIIASNTAIYRGGGMFAAHGVSLFNCQLSANSVSMDYQVGRGGGLDLFGNVTILNCVMNNNSSYFGGGMMIENGCRVTMSNVLMQANSGASGGGIYINNNSAGDIFNCSFASNNAVNGGVLYGVSSASVVRCSFTGNTATEHGSALWWGTAGSRLSMINCYAGGNAARSALYLSQLTTALVQNCTFACNTNASGNGLLYNYRNNNLVARNCIFWSNTVAQIVNNTNAPNQAVKVDSCCIQGGYSVPSAVNVITRNPILTGGYHLLYADSPCIGTGSPVGAPATDIEGNAWVYCDMGCGAFVGDMNSSSPSTGWLNYFFGNDNVDPNSDPNGDGVTVQNDYQNKTSPFGFPDLDGDGMSNGFETNHGLNPNNPSDATGDWNGDGISNLDEFRLGCLAVQVTVYDPDFNDDSWNLIYNGNMVASCGWNNGFMGTGMVYVYPGTEAHFTLQRPQAGQWGGCDEYGVSFTPVGGYATTVPWVALPGNSPNSATINYGLNGEPPDVSRAHWGFTTCPNQLQQIGNPQKGIANTTDPINTINGNISLNETDIILPCPSFDLSLERNYNSRGKDNGEGMGIGWTHSMAYSLTWTTNTAYAGRAGDFMVLHTGDGDDIWFPAYGDGTFDPPEDQSLTLNATVDGFRVVLAGGNTLEFDTTGAPRRIADGFGVGLTFSTNELGQVAQVTHDNGQSLAFSYSNYFLARVDVTSTNFYMLYDHDAGGRLVRATRVAGNLTNSTLYSYENVCNALTQRVNAAGHVFAYGVACYTNTPATTNSPAQMLARGTNMALNGFYYAHTLSYTNPGGFCTRVAYNRGDTNTILDYSYDPVAMRLNSIAGPGTPNTSIWSNTFTRYFYDQYWNTTNTVVQDGASGESLSSFAYFDDRHNVIASGVAYGNNPVPGWWQSAWNADNTLAITLDPAGHRTEFIYTNGKPSVIRACTSPGVGYETRLFYTAAGLLSAVTNANGHGLSNAYDASGYLRHVVPALGPDATLIRDNLGRVIATVVPGDNGPRTNAFTLDTLGRVLVTARPDGRTATAAYDILGNLTNQVDFAGRTNTFTWLPAGHLQASTRWLGSTPVTVSNIFDRQFNSLRITDPLGRVVESYKLDMQDRPVNVTNLEGRVMTFNRGVGDRILSVNRFDSTLLTNTFDTAGRVATTSYTGPNNYYYAGNSYYWLSTIVNRFAYYADGSLAMASNYSGTISNRFDILNRLAYTTGSVPLSAVSYSYFPAGQLSNVVTVAGTNSYSLDAADRLVAMQTPTGTFQFVYNPSNGLPCALVNPGGSLCTNRYDILDRVTSLVCRTVSGAVASAFGFRYNDAGMITNLTRLGSTNAFFYDSLDRLTNETRKGVSGYSKSYFYDLAGNRTKTVIDGAMDNYSYETVNGVRDDRLTAFGTGTSIQYDLAGNATNIQYGTGHVYNNLTNTVLRWNGCYQLTSASVHTNGSGPYFDASEGYGYDALGRRVWTSRGYLYYRIFHVYDGQHVVADLDEYTGNKILRTYTYGPGTDQLLAMTVFTGAVPRTYFTVRDHQNTVWALTDTNGAVVESYDFDAWGRVLSVKNAAGATIKQSALGNRYLFQGREYSWTTGLYYFRARWYDPVTGRWLSPDPIGINGGLNQYVFCANNPVNFVDPFGLCAEEGGGFWNWVKNDLFNVETVKQSWQLTSGADYSTGRGWGEGALGLVGGLANVVDAGFNVIPGKGQVEGGIKTAVKEGIKSLSEFQLKKLLNLGAKESVHTAKEEILSASGKDALKIVGKNPNIAVDNAGKVILESRDTAGVSHATDLLLEWFRR